MSSSKTSEPMKLAPVRSLNDFVLDSKRYLPPTFNDLKRFNNRVTSNLLYYQTNYFGVSTVVFLLFLIFGFNKILCGLFGVITTLAVVLFTLNKIPQLSALKAQYPAAIYGFGAVDLLVVYLTFRPILYLALALLIPVALWIIHASVRSRGLKNKISNKMEQIGASVYTNTPMGYVLTSLGFETKDFED